MSDSKDKDKNKGKTKNKDKNDDDDDNNDNIKEVEQEKEKHVINDDNKQIKDQKNDNEKLKENDQKDKEQKEERSGSGVFSHFVDAVVLSKSRERGSSTFSEDFKLYKGSFVSLGSPEIITISLETGEISRHRQFAKEDQVGTQRVYKKTSPNSQLTLYLPTRELVSTGNQPAIIKGILYADPKSLQGYRVYAQLTLTFRYGREDEEVMGLRFCNEAIMCLHQLWPRNEDAPEEKLTPLQEALIKRLGDGAMPFTLSLTPQAPPSVQLVPAKRYYGAPIGTSYEVRCFIADKTEDKFHRRATVRMGVRVIHRTDLFSTLCGPENFASIVNNQLSPPPPHDLKEIKQCSEPTPDTTDKLDTVTRSSSLSRAAITTISAPTVTTLTTSSEQRTSGNNQDVGNTVSVTTTTTTTMVSSKQKKSERVDSFPKIRLSPKSFRFSGRFGRSKSEAEKSSNDPFFTYSKSFQEYETCGGPQGSVDKPFLLQEGRVGLKASLDKAWYTHGEDVTVTVNIKNDSRKTVRKVRVCAIQHVDVCMFNNGKFKNVVADSDITSPNERTVGPGSSLNTTVVLKPQRGPTKNWIALEDSLQRSCEPDEITGAIAASAIRTPTIFSSSAAGGSNTGAAGCSAGLSGAIFSGNIGTSPEDRNVFAIYVSYYVKVKLTLSGMGGELSLKLPFALVHIDSSNKSPKTEVVETSNQFTITNCSENKTTTTTTTILSSSTTTTTYSKTAITPTIVTDSESRTHFTSSNLQCVQNLNDCSTLDKIETITDDTHLRNNNSNKTIKRKLIRHETLAKDDSSDEDDRKYIGDVVDDEDDDGVQTIELSQQTKPIQTYHYQSSQLTKNLNTRENDSDGEQTSNLQTVSPSTTEITSATTSTTTSSLVNTQVTCAQIHSRSS